VTGRQVGARAVIPLFPLGTVLVPGLVLPLHIFEPRYRRLMSDLQTRREDDRAFGVVAIREGWEVGEEGVTAMYDVGTLAVVREMVPYPDGRFDVVTNGDARFRIVAVAESDAPYLMAEVEWLAEDAPGDGAEAAILSAGVVRRFEAYRAAVSAAGAVEAAQMAELPPDARILSYLVAVAMVLDLSDRQRLLEAATTTDRLRIEVALLARETMLMTELPSLPAVDLARTTSGLN
jgi:Lon protease-like protein